MWYSLVMAGVGRRVWAWEGVGGQGEGGERGRGCEKLTLQYKYWLVVTFNPSEAREVSVLSALPCPYYTCNIVTGNGSATPNLT